MKYGGHQFQINFTWLGLQWKFCTLSWIGISSKTLVQGIVPNIYLPRVKRGCMMGFYHVPHTNIPPPPFPFLKWQLETNRKTKKHATASTSIDTHIEKKIWLNEKQTQEYSQISLTDMQLVYLFHIANTIKICHYIFAVALLYLPSPFLTKFVHHRSQNSVKQLERTKHITWSI